MRMASPLEPILDLSSMSLYKRKGNSVTSLASQNERRLEVLKRQKEKREQKITEIRFSANDDDDDDESMDTKKPQWPPRQHRSIKSVPCPIDMMLAEWLFSPPEDIGSWFVVPCPRGYRCLVVVHSHRTFIYDKQGHVVRAIYTRLPKQTILYCIYDNRASIYHIIDIIMWNGQDYATQTECQCRFFMLTSLQGDPRLGEQFQILPRIKLEEKQDLFEAEDGYLFYHPLGFYEPGYSPLVCWLQPFMIEEILGIKVSYRIDIPEGYTTAHAYMFEEQSHRKEQQSVGKTHKKRNKQKKENENQHEELMSMDD